MSRHLLWHNEAFENKPFHVSDYSNNNCSNNSATASCQAEANAFCDFPFRYKGRLYDTCITLDKSDQQAWCSTGTGTNREHQNDYDKLCEADCDVNDCPVGFYRNHPDATCYQISSDHPDESVASFDDARAKCLEQGARLWQPRALAPLSAVLEAELKVGHFPWSSGPYSATGWTMQWSNGIGSVYYSDGSKMADAMQASYYY